MTEQAAFTTEIQKNVLQVKSMFAAAAMTQTAAMKLAARHSRQETKLYL